MINFEQELNKAKAKNARLATSVLEVGFENQHLKNENEHLKNQIEIGSSELDKLKQKIKDLKLFGLSTVAFIEFKGLSDAYHKFLTTELSETGKSE
ncbi:hypothetical protein K4M64_004524 [Salmonella enterica]|nr:hypothetical protein [Salmonella enterica]